MGSPPTQHKRTAITVSEGGGYTQPTFSGFVMNPTPALQFTNCPLDIVCPEGNIHLWARLEPNIRLEEYDTGFRSRNPESIQRCFLSKG